MFTGGINLSPNQVVALAARLFAIWLAVSSFQLAGLDVAMSGNPVSAQIVLILIALAMAAVAILIWRYPIAVAHTLLKDLKPSTTNLGTDDLALVACIVLGLWLFVASVLPALLRQLSMVTIIFSSGFNLESLQTRGLVTLVIALVNAAISWVLIFRARAVSAYLLSVNR